jgi:hypothetical protein
MAREISTESDLNLTGLVIPCARCSFCEKVAISAENLFTIECKYQYQKNTFENIISFSEKCPRYTEDLYLY